MHYLCAQVLGDDLVLAGLVTEFVQQVLVRLGVRKSGKGKGGETELKRCILLMWHAASLNSQSRPEGDGTKSGHATSSREKFYLMKMTEDIVA